MSSDPASAPLPRPELPRPLFGDGSAGSLFPDLWTLDLVPPDLLVLGLLAPTPRPAGPPPVAAFPLAAPPIVVPPAAAQPVETPPAEAPAPPAPPPDAPASVAQPPVAQPPTAQAPTAQAPVVAPAPSPPANPAPVAPAPAAPPPAAPEPAQSPPVAPQPVAPPPAVAAPPPPPPPGPVPAPAPITDQPVPDTAQSNAASAASTATGNGADQAMLGDLARAQFGLSGAGVTIGILSDSFDVRGGYAGDVAGGSLAAGATILKEGAAGSSDEGRAMAQLIHQVAPDAHILFYSAFGGAADFANGIRALANAGAGVIVDDVTYLNEPFYQDGAAIQAAVEQVVASGVSYFTSASNEGANFYEAAFKPLTAALPGLSGGFVCADFGAGTPYVNLTIAKGATATLDLQWDEPFAGIGGTGATTSLGMVLYDSSNRIVAYALRSQIGGDPVELLQYTNTTGTTGFHMAVITDGGRGVPGQFKVIAYGQGTRFTDPGAGLGSGTIIGHEMVPEANTVGAIGYTQTPRYDGGGTIETYSSLGPGRFLFDAAGNRLTTPLQGSGVDFVAPDGAATSVFNPFYGTSAAAPNAAAVAALMLQENPNLTPAQTAAILATSTAAAGGPAGGAGAGLIQANAAVKAAVALAGPAGQSHSFVPTAPGADTPGTVLTSAAIRNTQAEAAAVSAAPAATSDFTALPDLASGLVLAGGDSLGGVAFSNVALLNGFYGDAAAAGLFNPVHIVA